MSYNSSTGIVLPPPEDTDYFIYWLNHPWESVSYLSILIISLTHDKMNVQRVSNIIIWGIIAFVAALLVLCAGMIALLHLSSVMLCLLQHSLWPLW
jgi:hypothetical protein